MSHHSVYHTTFITISPRESKQKQVTCCIYITYYSTYINVFTSEILAIGFVHAFRMINVAKIGNYDLHINSLHGLYNIIH